MNKSQLNLLTTSTEHTATAIVAETGKRYMLVLSKSLKYTTLTLYIDDATNTEDDYKTYYHDDDAIQLWLGLGESAYIVAHKILEQYTTIQTAKSINQAISALDKAKLAEKAEIRTRRHKSKFTIIAAYNNFEGVARQNCRDPKDFVQGSKAREQLRERALHNLYHNIIADLKELAPIISDEYIVQFARIIGD